MSETMVQFVTAACNGDTDAMAKLYAKTLKSSYFLAATLSENDDEAAEITKKAYAKAFCSISKLKKPEAFEIWMKQNVSAVYKDGCSFDFDESYKESDEVSSEFFSESILDDSAKCEEIFGAVKNLKPELKAATVLHYNNGMPIPALSKFLSVSEGTVNALLSKARDEILGAVGLEKADDENPASLPVLTRIFQASASNVTIDSARVREIFIFAIEAYRAANAAKEEAVPAPVPAAKEEVKAEEPVKEEAEAETKAVDPETLTEANDNVVSFKEKINEILNFENIRSSEDNSENSENSEKDELDIPEFTPSSTEVEETVRIYGGEAPNDDTLHPPLAPIVNTSAEPGPKKFDITKINKKAIAIAAAVLVVLIIVVAAFAKGGKDKPDVENQTSGNVSQSTEDAMANSASKWVPGGFEECSEIVYLNENYCAFKSVTTGKYGLLDYQGNVVLQPNYEKFERCGSGKDYTSNNNYHLVVYIEGERYGITTVNGEIIVETTVHPRHEMDAFTGLEGSSYDERDRYFEGYAAARKDGKWGYVSQEKDKKVINYDYEAVNDLNETGEALFCDYCRPVTGGFVAVKKDGMMGIINLDEDIIADFSYTNIMPGKDGVFIACKNGTWGVILVGNAMNTFKGVNITVNVEAEPPTEDEAEDITTSSSGTSRKKYKVIAEDGINIRTDAGAEYEKIGSLEYGDIVEGYGTKLADNGNYWVRIKHNNEYGWIAMTMVERVRN